MKKSLIVLLLFIQFSGIAQRIIKEDCVGNNNSEGIIMNHENNDSTTTIVYNEAIPGSSSYKLKALKIDKHQNVIINTYIDSTVQYYQSFNNLIHFQDDGSFIITNYNTYTLFDKNLNHIGTAIDSTSNWIGLSYFAAGKPDGGYILVGYYNDGFEGAGGGMYTLISLSRNGDFIWNKFISETNLFTNAYLIRTNTCTIVPKENNKAVISLRSINGGWLSYYESLNYTIALDSSGNIENEYSKIVPFSFTDYSVLSTSNTISYEPGKLPVYYYKDSTLYLTLLNTDNLSIIKEDSLKVPNSLPFFTQKNSMTDSSNLFFVFGTYSGSVTKVICKDLNLTTLWTYDFASDSTAYFSAIGGITFDNHSIFAYNTFIRDGVMIWKADVKQYDTINYNGQTLTSDAYYFIKQDYDNQHILLARNYSLTMLRIRVLDINTGFTTQDFFINTDGISGSGGIKYLGDGKIFFSNTDYNTCRIGGGDIHLATYSNEYNTIKGIAYVDYNNNLTKENSEPVYPYGYVTTTTVNDTQTQHISNNHPFIFYVNSGSYKTTLHLYNNYFAIAPPLFTTAHNNYGNNDTVLFALHPIATVSDISMQLINNWMTRLGQNNAYTVSIENKGTAIANGKVKVLMDSRLLNINTNPAYAYRNGDTIVWNIGNLAPLSKGEAVISFTAETPSALNAGDTIISKAWYQSDSIDAMPTDNYTELKETIRASYDPNEKAITSGETLTPQQVSNGDYISYIIHFQNKGNDTAFKVIVLDTLSEHVDINSLQIINTSNPYQLEIINKKILKFTFENIKLSYDTTNISSTGYIAYKVKPVNTLAVGNTVQNTAEIFFDYNAPIRTNTVETKVLLLSATHTNKSLGGEMTVYPNPNNGIFTIRFESKTNATVQLQLTDVTGSILYNESRQHLNKTEFSLNESNLAKGIYWLRLTDGKDNYSSAVIVQ